MARLSIQLPEEVKAIAETRAAASGHASLDEYLEWLIRADAGDDFGAPEHLRPQSQAQLGHYLRKVPPAQPRK
jgi:hypothetical protein